MVPPAPDAWASGPIAPIRTESLPTAVSVAGKRDFRGGEKCADTSPDPQISGLRDQAVVQEPRQFEAFATSYGNSPQTVNCVVVVAGTIEPVSISNSPPLFSPHTHPQTPQTEGSTEGNLSWAVIQPEREIRKLSSTCILPKSELRYSEIGG